MTIFSICTGIISLLQNLMIALACNLVVLTSTNTEMSLKFKLEGCSNARVKSTTSILLQS